MLHEAWNPPCFAIAWSGDVAIVGTIDAYLVDVPNDLLGADLDLVREGSRQ